MGAEASETPRPGSGGPRLVLAVTDGITARTLLRGQAAFLSRQGFDVWVAGSPGADLAEFERQESVAVVEVPMKRRIAPLADLASLYRLTLTLRRLRPDCVNASTPKAGVLGMLAAWMARVPNRIYTLRGLPLETTRGLKRRLLGWGERTATRLAHRVVCVSPSLRRRCLELGLVSPDKAVVVANGSSNGVDSGRFRPTPERRREGADLRRRLGIPAEAVVIGYVGRLTRDKGTEDLASVFLDGPPADAAERRLLLVGEFEDADSIPPPTRRRLREDPRVLITGWVTDTAPYYAAMDLLAFPSYREGLPNAPLEAAASGLPTVGYRAVGTVDAVDDEITGTLVPTGDRQALAGALEAYLGDAGLRRRHGAAARERAERLFHRDVVWQGWLEEYRRLLTPAASR